MKIDPIQHEGRLQRKASASGKMITSFEQILLRHGLFVLMLAILCSWVPHRNAYLAWGLERFLQYPLRYLIAALVLLAFFMTMTKVFGRKLNSRQMLWILYLLGVSICEEWVFRLALPGFTSGFIGRIPAIILCNSIFAAMHYFTLRWKLRWCVITYFGAAGLSRLMFQGDLMLVIGVHWFVTFLNTPVPIGSKE